MEEENKVLRERIATLEANARGHEQQLVNEMEKTRSARREAVMFRARAEELAKQLADLQTEKR